MKIHYFPSPTATNTLSTAELREAFLVGGLFRSGEINARYTDLDRMVVGAALPDRTPLALAPAKELGTSFFLERREIGILNLGSPGTVRVGREAHALGTLDCLYVGLGERDVVFENGDEGQSAFYFISTPAHAQHPTTKVTRAQVQGDPVGDPAKANRRRILKYIHPDGIKSCQLMLGCTELEPGNVWNTMPPHEHSRRSEIYLYFDLGENIVMHFLGRPEATRHLVVRDREVVLCPAWSIHSGAGTACYRFVWAMGGDNQVFGDMDAVALAQLR